MEYKYICNDRKCYIDHGALDPEQVVMVETFPGNRDEKPEYEAHCPNCNAVCELTETYQCEECGDYFHIDDVINKDYFYLCEYCNREVR